jgi:hypothetical protein
MWGEKRFKLCSRKKGVLNHMLKLNCNTSTQNCNLLFWQIMAKTDGLLYLFVRRGRQSSCTRGLESRCSSYLARALILEAPSPSPGSCWSPHSSSTVWNKLSIQIEASTLYHRFQPQINKAYQSAMNLNAHIQRWSHRGRAGHRGRRRDRGWSGGLGLEGESILEAIVSTARPGATGIPRPGRCRRRPV